jgi:hypothetical protein
MHMLIRSLNKFYRSIINISNINPKITLCYSYFNQQDAIIKHVENWISWSRHVRDKFSFLIVDDCSHKPALQTIDSLSLDQLDLSVYRVIKDLHCNISGARNLAAKKCLTEWMMILDMDTLVSEHLAENLLELASNNRSGIAYKFSQRFPDSDEEIPHGAVCLIKVADYWNVGGCEEDLVGNYGYTDPIFWYRAKGKLKVEIKSEYYLDIIRDGHTDMKRNSEQNLKLFESKKHNNNWSDDFIRFDWEKVY